MMRRYVPNRLRIAFALAALSLAFVVAVSAMSPRLSFDFQDGDSDSKQHSAEIVRRLRSGYPAERQAAAEDVARRADMSQLKMIEGVRLQEKDERARLAMDWALYRLGQSSRLFNVVRELDSQRHDQAEQYLAQIETPAPLYVFLEKSPPLKEKGRLRLIQILGQVGDKETLAQLAPFTESADKKLSEAARNATRQITARINNSSAPSSQTRPRKIGIEKDQR